MLDDVIRQPLDKALLLKGCRELEGAEPDPGVSHAAHDSPRLSLDPATAAAAMARDISQGSNMAVVYRRNVLLNTGSSSSMKHSCL